MTEAPGAVDRPPLIIVSRSGRALAQIAARDFQPHVVDLFADADTREAAAALWQATPTGEFGFDARIYPTLAGWRRQLGDVRIVLGSGFESAPGLLARLADLFPVLAGRDRVMRALLSMPAALRNVADLAPAPQTRRTAPCQPWQPWQWLHKRAGGSGGQHVRRATGRPGPRAYYQRYLPGRSESALYFAGARETNCRGFFQHLRLGGTRGFTYQGAVGGAALPGKSARLITATGARVAARFGLRGLFGLDFVRDRADRLRLVDINPRPPVTLELLADAADLLAAHVAPCLPDRLLYSSAGLRAARAHLTCFAERPWTVPPQFMWPDCTADIPRPGTLIPAGHPICTVRAEGSDVAAALAALQHRLDALAARLPHAGTAHGVLPSTTTISFSGGSRHV